VLDHDSSVPGASFRDIGLLPVPRQLPGAVRLTATTGHDADALLRVAATRAHSADALLERNGYKCIAIAEVALWRPTMSLP